MSARQEALESFAETDADRDSLNDYFDAYARELAEKILKLRSTVPDLKAGQHFKSGYDAALMVAAFEIDREVQ